MIYRLRNKFISITMLSSLAVFAALFLILYVTTTVQANSSLDMFDALPFGPERMNPEPPYSTRFFTVQFDQYGSPAFADISSIMSISKEDAANFALKALAGKKERGWIGDYRYKVYQTNLGNAVIFINGIDTKVMNRNFLLAAAGVFAGSIIVILIIVVFFSKRAIKPVAESYDKQKQFITDANHEPKTPLTLIRTDLELAEAELGKNEWLDDIHQTAENMTELVESLITLARMDETDTKLIRLPLDLSGVVSDTAYVFEQLTKRKGLTLYLNVPSGVFYTGDEAALRQLTSILLDNAAKYCDRNGKITVTLTPGKHPVLTVDNSFLHVNETDLKRLFDRFYRSDKARTTGSGSGIGLSIAQAIVEKHHGQIEAQKRGDDEIRFWVRL